MMCFIVCISHLKLTIKFMNSFLISPIDTFVNISSYLLIFPSAEGIPTVE